ncbi:MAG: hypothetical protein Harvfovirus55_4 [Harvfovirus sp.]|uniref:Uncharacterized protein n=1 Tax=Harvfovirus sp. TaxID=2487768 RepID=A0A3G5A3B4_9VIRU|nr:MAG: hypothetical protein Harvfovirus55_4 [Harvfovirus sp.]
MNSKVQKYLNKLKKHNLSEKDKNVYVSKLEQYLSSSWLHGGTNGSTAAPLDPRALSWEELAKIYSLESSFTNPKFEEYRKRASVNTILLPSFLSLPFIVEAPIDVREKWKNAHIGERNKVLRYYAAEPTRDDSWHRSSNGQFHIDYYGPDDLDKIDVKALAITKELLSRLPPSMSAWAPFRNATEWLHQYGFLNVPPIVPDPSLSLYDQIRTIMKGSPDAPLVEKYIAIDEQLVPIYYYFNLSRPRPTSIPTDYAAKLGIPARRTLPHTPLDLSKLLQNLSSTPIAPYTLRTPFS